MITYFFLGAGVVMSSIGFGFMFGAVGFFTFPGLILILFSALRAWKGL